MIEDLIKSLRCRRDRQSPCMIELPLVYQLINKVYQRLLSKIYKLIDIDPIGYLNRLEFFLKDYHLAQIKPRERERIEKYLDLFLETGVRDKIREITTSRNHLEKFFKKLKNQEMKLGFLRFNLEYHKEKSIHVSSFHELLLLVSK